MTLYLDAIKGLLPQEYASRIGSLDTATVTLLDAIVRFSTGGDTPSDASSSTRTQWAKQQLLVSAALDKVKSRARQQVVHVLGDEDGNKALEGGVGLDCQKGVTFCGATCLGGPEVREVGTMVSGRVWK